MKKGTLYSEFQILMFVIMWQHDMSHKRLKKHNSVLSIGRLYIWFDSAWNLHGIPGKINFFFYKLMSNVDKVKGLKAKTKIIWINARRMFRNWSYDKLWINSVLSFLNYISLHKAGFRVSCSTSDDGYTSMYRFFWKDRIIEDMADIDRNGVDYNTMFNGKSRQLGDRKHVINYTVEDIANMFDNWTHFNGFTGERCGKCLRSVNTFAYGTGWLCNCGHYNTQSISSVNMQHENPDLGPSAKVIRLGYEKSNKFKNDLSILKKK